MKVNSINPSRINRQSFGQVKEPSTEFTKFLTEEVFQGKQIFVDAWNDALVRITKNQENNPFYDLVFKIEEIYGRKAQPVIHVYEKNKSFIPKNVFTPDSYRLSKNLPEGFMSATEDADQYATYFAEAQSKKISVKA